ncbi:MAG TPA: S9 family peptidase [Gemmatimonadales bacterium]|nr:S9 family peptidase [Gemmatimonadales bacterium]
MRRTALLLAIALLPPSFVTATPPTLDQSLSLLSVRNPQISPDGRFVAYERQETDWKENAYPTQIFVVEVGSGRSVQLTRGNKASSSPQWSPDGRWIAFLTERDPIAAPKPEQPDGQEKHESEAKPDPRQIWLISPSGGEAWPLTAHAAKIDSFLWSKDARSIAFTAPAPEAKARKDRQEKYGDYEVVESDFDQNQLWAVDLAPAERQGRPVPATRLTNDPRRNVTSFDWSPDSTKIAFAATANPLLAFSSESDLYLVERARPGDAKPIVTLPGPEDSPTFSADGRELAFETALGEPYHYYANGHVATVRLDDVEKRPARIASEVSDRTASFDEDAHLIGWGPEGIWFWGLERTDSHLFRIPPQGPLVRVSAPDRLALGGISMSRDFKTAAFVIAGDRRLPEVAVSGLTRFQPRTLTDMTAQTAGWTLGSVEMVRWKSSDGAEIEGVLHRPADFQAGRKHPLLVVIHGGPTGISRPVLNPGNRYYPIEVFLAKGALVLEPNYRGSAGYGHAFRALNVRNLGVGDMADVMSGVDAMVAQGLADPDRLGVMGWSQGGYISAFLATHTDRFKAISVGAGISDWTTYYVNTDITPFTRQYLKATPWDDPEIYARTSPISTIRQAKTPTLIQHGEADKRVPIPNGYELYRGLRDQHVPVRMIVYSGFGHGITKPKSNRAVLQHNLDWFSHYVWGEPIPSDSPLRGRGESEEGP